MEKKVSVIVPVYPDVGVAGALCAEHHGSDL